MEALSPIEWALVPVKKYGIFAGRAPRAEYWWFYLGTVIAGIPLAIIDRLLHTAVLGLLLNLALLVPWVAVSVRRLHDTNRSGWWLIALVGAFGLIGVMVGVGAAGALNSTAGSFTIFVVGALVFLAATVTLLVFMILPGTEGPNRFGPDPYGPDDLEQVFA